MWKLLVVQEEVSEKKNCWSTRSIKGSCQNISAAYQNIDSVYGVDQHRVKMCLLV